MPAEQPIPQHLLTARAMPPTNMLDPSILYGDVIIPPPSPNTVKKLVAGAVLLGIGAGALNLTSGSAAQDTTPEEQPAASTIVVNNNDMLPDLKAPANEIINIDAPVNSATKVEQQTPINEGITQEQMEWIAPQVNKQVKENLTVMIPIYKRVQEVTGLDWKLLASAHYRENNNDPRYSVHAGELLGTTNVDFGDIKPVEIEENAISAAKLYIRNAKNYYGIDATKPMTDEEIKLSLLSYNRGHKYKDINASPELSAYVMNMYHGAEFMKWSNDIRLENHSKKGEIDKKIGAYPFWLYLQDAEGNDFVAFPGLTSAA